MVGELLLIAVFISVFHALAQAYHSPARAAAASMRRSNAFLIYLPQFYGG
jgi:hypothetical protein